MSTIYYAVANVLTWYHDRAFQSGGPVGNMGSRRRLGRTGTDLKRIPERQSFMVNGVLVRARVCVRA